MADSKRVLDYKEEDNEEEESDFEEAVEEIEVIDREMASLLRVGQRCLDFKSEFKTCPVSLLSFELSKL